MGRRRRRRTWDARNAHWILLGLLVLTIGLALAGQG